MLAIIKTDGVFLSKFSNPFNMKSADFRMEGEEKEQFLMLSMKHAGSLIIISDTGRFSTKNGADSKFTDIAYLVFRTWMGDDLEKFLTLIKNNKLSIGLELVVPRILGEHPGEALVPYFAVTSVTNVTTLQHLSQDNLIKFCLNNKLPCGEHWLIPNLLGQTKFDDIIGEIDKIRFKNSGDSGDSCGDGGTSEFINKINELTLARGGIAFLGNIPHGEVQGKVCEGVIARILPGSALLKIQDMNDILQGNKGDFDKRLEKLKKLGEWFKDHYNFENIIYKQDEIKSFFNKVSAKVEATDSLFHGRTGTLVQENDRYWFLNHLKNSSTMEGEASLLLKSLLRLPQLKKIWLKSLKNNETVSSRTINKVKSEPHKLIERITEIYKSAEINEDFAKLVSQLTSLDKKKVKGLSDKLKSLEEAILEKLIKELEQDSQSSSNKDELSPILVELKRLKKTKDEEFNKRFISLIGSKHKIKYLIQKISALKSSSGDKDLEEFLINPPEDLKDKLPSLKKEALNLLKKELKELQREIEALWNVSVYLQSDKSYIVHIKLLHDMSLVNVPGLHLRRGHIVSVDVMNSSINLVGAGHITDELDDENEQLFYDSKEINENSIGIIKLKNQNYMELRSIRETLNKLLKKLKEGSLAENKLLSYKSEFLNTFKKELKINLQPTIFNRMGGSNVNVLTLADQAFNRINLGEFYEFLIEKLPLEKIDIDSSACLMQLYQEFKRQQNIPEKELNHLDRKKAGVTPLVGGAEFFSVLGVEEENNPNGGSASSPASLARIHCD